MQSELQLALLGNISLTLGDTDLATKLLSKSQALLCYLAVSGATHTRQELAGLLWSDMDESDARRNLRVNLTMMRPLLEPYLIATRQTLSFDRQQPYWLDVETFESYLRRSQRPDGGSDLTMLREAVALYNGPFLSGLDVRDAPLFEEWLLRQRNRLEQDVLRGLDRLVEACIAQEVFDEGVGYAHRLLEIEPWREKAHQQLMWLLARSGQHSAALAQFELCRDVLQEELGVEPAPDTLALYETIRDQREAGETRRRMVPPLPEETAVPTPPFQAPAQVPYFTNRVEELAALGTDIRQASQRRRLALTGMGGSGKTSLVTQLAHALRDEFPDGVLWAHATTGDPKVIAENWGAAYGYDFSELPGMTERGAALRSVLAEKRALLVLDDVTSAARVRPLLPAGGPAITLITTRNAQIARALDAESMQLTTFDAEAGLSLFAQIVGHQRVEQEPAAAAQICRLLQNLPLALTIAAHHLAYRRRRSLGDYAARLADESNRLRLLDLADREVRVSFAISWQGLDETQRRVFGLLGVFDGRSFTAESLAAVAGLDPYPAQDRLDDLVMLSLLTVEGDRRYRQHPLLADFAREQLGQDDGAYFRMAQFYADYARTYRDNYAALRPEWENLMAGIDAAHRLQRWQMVLDYTAALRDAWFARGRHSEARRAYAGARTAAMALEDEPVLADTLFHWGQACIEQGDYDEGRERLQAAETLYAALDAPGGIASSKYEQARIANMRNQFDAAEALLGEAHALRAAEGDTAGLADVLAQRAWLCNQRGAYATAVDLGRQALAMHDEAANTLAVTDALRLLADAHLMLSHQASGSAVKEHVVQAETYARRALEHSAEANLAGETAAAHLLLAKICREQGRLEEAETHAQESLQLRHKLGDQRGTALVLYNLGLINFRMQEFGAAQDLSARSLEISRALQDSLGMAFALQLQGDARLALDDGAGAVEAWSAARDLARRLDHGLLLQTLNTRLEA